MTVCSTLLPRVSVAVALSETKPAAAAGTCSSPVRLSIHDGLLVTRHGGTKRLHGGEGHRSGTAVIDQTAASIGLEKSVACSRGSQCGFRFSLRPRAGRCPGPGGGGRLRLPRRD